MLVDILATARDVSGVVLGFLHIAELVNVEEVLILFKDSSDAREALYSLLPVLRFSVEFDTIEIMKWSLQKNMQIDGFRMTSNYKCIFPGFNSLYHRKTNDNILCKQIAIFGDLCANGDFDVAKAMFRRGVVAQMLPTASPDEIRVIKKMAYDVVMALSMIIDDTCVLKLSQALNILSGLNLCDLNQCFSANLIDDRQISILEGACTRRCPLIAAELIKHGALLKHYDKWAMAKRSRSRNDPETAQLLESLEGSGQAQRPASMNVRNDI